MRNFVQLSDVEKQKAIDHCIEEIFVCIVEEDTVPDCLEKYKEIIFAAAAESERLHTPWFFLDILQDEIEEQPEMQETILTEAKRVAELSWYPGPDEMIIYLPPNEEEKKNEEVTSAESKKNFNVN